MNLISRLWLGAVTVCALAACGESEEAFRSSYRTKAVADCRRGADSQPNPAGVNTEQLCNCMVDGYMRATPSDRLKAERNQSSAPAAANAAMQQCLQQVVQGMGGTPGAIPPAPGAAEAARAVNEADRAVAEAQREAGAAADEVENAVR